MKKPAGIAGFFLVRKDAQNAGKVFCTSEDLLLCKDEIINLEKVIKLSNVRD
jgi:hypothetical protein